MKPEDLKAPFTWNERSTLIQDRVWYVAPLVENAPSFSFPGWTDPVVFGNDRPICLEYCSGNGAWIAAKAQVLPECNWVGLEIKFSRVRKIWSKIKNHQLSNLFAICGEALDTTQRFISADSVQDIFINFPDPWPKRRHAKYRLIQAEFVKELGRILKPEGHLTIVTDDPGYSAQIIKMVRANPTFSSIYPEPYFSTEYPDYGTSYFEDLWRGKGKAIRYHKFQKKGS